MIARRYAPLLFALLLSGFMSLMVSGISTLRATGPVPGFLELWISAWLAAWLFAFPAVLLITPLARRVVEGLVRNE